MKSFFGLARASAPSHTGVTVPQAPPVWPGTASLARLHQMGLLEVVCRTRQQIRKTVERFGPNRGAATPAALLLERAPALANPAEAQRIVREYLPLRFFPGASEPLAPALLQERMPDACRNVITAATNTVATGTFDLLGYSGLWFGDPIDWQFDPVWNRRSPRVHWSRVNALDPATVGDSKIIWELNRHQWIVHLALAWRLTGDERYVDACVEYIDSWLAENPTGTGINWASSLEVSYRLIAWCWILALLHDAPRISGEWLMKILASVWEHAVHVSRYLSYYFSPNTHLTGEALGLFYAGTLFPEFTDAYKWQSLGARILIEESRRQISWDGVHFEQSTCYQRYTIDLYEHYVLLAQRNYVTVFPEVMNRLRAMVEFLLAVRHPDGSLPAIGDEDGGAVLPLEPRTPRDARGTFSVAAAIFDRADFAWAAESPAADLVWLMGSEGLATFAATQARPPAGSASRAFPIGGYAVMRDTWEPDAHQMIVDIGPLGPPRSNGHAHADLLSLQCAVFGRPCLVDAGNYTYTPEPEWRHYFRETAAHNTIMIDGRGQSEPAGPFRWQRRPYVHLREWQSNPELDFLDAEHDAFSRPGDPVVHRRRVVFVKPRYWMIVDDLIGTARHRIDLVFQFDPMRVSIERTPWARAERPLGRALWIRAFSAVPSHLSLHTGETAPIRGWVAPDYGRRLPAPSITCTLDATLPRRIITLIYPDPRPSPVPPAVHALSDAHGVPTGLFFESSGESVRVDERTILHVGA